MALLEVAIDPRGAVSGGQRVSQAVRQMAGETISAQQRFQGLFSSLTKVESTAKKVGLALVGLFSAAGAAVSLRGATQLLGGYEKALVGVGNAADLTGVELEKLGKDILTLSRTSLPVAQAELLALAEAVGGLGVRGSADILKFVDTVARLGTLTKDFRGEEAARELKQLTTVAGESIGTVDKLASVIVRLDDEVVGSASQIAKMATELGRFTSGMQVSAAELVAVSAAITQVGNDSAKGAAAIGATFEALGGAIRKGTSGLSDLSRLTGQTREELAATFNRSAVEGLQLFIDSLGKVSQSEAASALDAIGLEGLSTLKVLRPLVENSHLLEKALADMADELKNTRSLTEESNRVYATLEGSLARLRNTFSAGILEFGKSTGTMAAFVNTATGAVTALFGLQDTMGLVTRDALVMADAIKAVAAAFAVLAVLKVPALLASISAGFARTATAAKALAVTLARHPLGLAAVGISAAVVALYKYRDATVEIEGRSVQVRDVVGGAWDTIKERASSAFDLIRQGATIWDDFGIGAEDALRAITDAFASFGAPLDDAGNQFRAFFGGVIRAAEVLVPVIGDKVRAVATIFVSLAKIATGPFRLVLAIARDVFAKLISEFNEVAEKIRARLERIGQGATGAFAFVGNAARKIVTAFEEIEAPEFDFGKSLPRFDAELKEFLKSAQSFRRGLGELTETEDLFEAFGKAQQAFAEDTGESIGQAFIGGLRRTFPAIDRIFADLDRNIAERKAGIVGPVGDIGPFDVRERPKPVEIIPEFDPTKFAGPVKDIEQLEKKARELADAFGKYDDATKNAVRSTDELIRALRLRLKEQDALNALQDRSSALARFDVLAAEELSKAADRARSPIKGLGTDLEAVAQRAEELAASRAEVESFFDALEAPQAARSARELVDSLRFENETLALTNKARERALALREFDIATMSNQTAEVRALREEFAALFEEQQRALSSGVELSTTDQIVEALRDQVQAQQLAAATGERGAAIARFEATAQRELAEAVRLATGSFLPLADAMALVAKTVAEIAGKRQELDQLFTDRDAPAAEKEARDLVEALKFEQQLLGESNREREKSIALRQFDAATAGVQTQEIMRLRQEFEDLIGQNQRLDEMVQGVDAFASGFTSGLEQAITAAEDFDDALRIIEQSIARVFLREFFTEPLEEAIQDLGRSAVAGFDSLFGGKDKAAPGAGAALEGAEAGGQAAAAAATADAAIAIGTASSSLAGAAGAMATGAKALATPAAVLSEGAATLGTSSLALARPAAVLSEATGSMFVAIPLLEKAAASLSFAAGELVAAAVALAAASIGRAATIDPASLALAKGGVLSSAGGGLKLIPSAKGNVFASALGNAFSFRRFEELPEILNRPVAFPLSGGFGTAGERAPAEMEGILPLARSPRTGKLGVEAVSMSTGRGQSSRDSVVNVQFTQNVTTPSVDSFRRSRRQLEKDAGQSINDLFQRGK